MNYRTFPLDDTNPTGFEEAVLFEIDEEEQAAPLISEREPSATLFGSESTRNNKSPRLIKRNLPRFQSEQNVNVVNRNVEWSLTYGHDWFHVMLRWPTHVSIFTLICVWTLLATLFAWVYQLIDARVPAKECGLGEPGVSLKS